MMLRFYICLMSFALIAMHDDHKNLEKILSAARACDHEQLATLVTAENSNLIVFHKETILHQCIRAAYVPDMPLQDFKKCCQLLVDKKANLNRPTLCNKLPLYIAAMASIETGYFEPVQFLLELGADPFLVCDNDCIFDICQKMIDRNKSNYLNKNTYKLLKMFSDKSKQLTHAALCCNSDQVRRLVNKKNATAKDSNSFEPLFYAIKNGHLAKKEQLHQTISLLVANGANVNGIIGSKKPDTTYLHIACVQSCLYGNLKVLKTLLAMGAKPDKETMSPLDLAETAIEIFPHALCVYYLLKTHSSLRTSNLSDKSNIISFFSQLLAGKYGIDKNDQ